PKLTIMKPMVPTVAHGLVKPSDIFIRKAQTISNRPASRRKIQAMTVSLAWRAGSSRRHAHNGRGRPLSALYLGQGPRQSRFRRRGMPIRAQVMLKSRHFGPANLDSRPLAHDTTRP